MYTECLSYLVLESHGYISLSIECLTRKGLINICSTNVSYSMVVGWCMQSCGNITFYKNNFCKSKVATSGLLIEINANVCCENQPFIFHRLSINLRWVYSKMANYLYHVQHKETRGFPHSTIFAQINRRLDPSVHQCRMCKGFKQCLIMQCQL